MQYDEKALEILDRKYQRFVDLGAVPLYSVCLLELPSILQWILSVPVLRSYVKAKLAMHDREDALVARAVGSALKSFEQLGAEVRALPAFTLVPDESKLPAPIRWERLDQALAAARATKAPDERRDSAETVAFVLSARAKAAWQRTVDAAPDPAVRDAIDETIKRALVACEGTQQRLAARALTLETSPRAALIRLVEICRAKNPPSDDVEDWTSRFPCQPYLALIESTRLKADPVEFYKEARIALPRFIEHLHVLGSTTLSHPDGRARTGSHRSADARRPCGRD